MKIVTWNVNGIRSCCRQMTLKKILDSFDADIICFQETKITHDQMDLAIAAVEGYSAYFSFSKVKGGYSGVATFCKEHCRPKKAEEGLTNILTPSDGNRETLVGCYGDSNEISNSEVLAIDSEGRTVITEHSIVGSDSSFVIINVYCPRADSDDKERYDFKMNFYKLLEGRARALLENGRHVVIVGDFNAVYSLRDVCDEEYSQESDMSPSRKWLRQLITKQSTIGLQKEYEFCLLSEERMKGDFYKRFKSQFVDTFRYFYPDKRDAFTCWRSSTRARETNYGSRIDYIVANAEFVVKYASGCLLLPDVKGSDHCPVVADFNIEIDPSIQVPLLCSSLLPGFTGSQTSIKQFIMKNVKSNSSNGSIGQSEEPPKKKVKVQVKTSSNKPKNILNFFTSTKKETPPEQADKVKSSLNVPLKFEIPKQQSGIDKSNCNKEKISSWKKLLGGPEAPPLCTGHKEPCVLRTVKKDGANKGKQFYCCPRPDGRADDKEASCKSFIWKTKKS